jgi:hypothetical protein
VRNRGPRSLTHTPTTRNPRAPNAGADEGAVDTLGVASLSTSNPSPIVTEARRFDDLPLGSRGTRRAIARWSDGTESEVLTWYAE